MIKEHARSWLHLCASCTLRYGFLLPSIAGKIERSWRCENSFCKGWGNGFIGIWREWESMRKWNSWDIEELWIAFSTNQKLWLKENLRYFAPFWIATGLLIFERALGYPNPRGTVFSGFGLSQSHDQQNVLLARFFFILLNKRGLWGSGLMTFFPTCM